MKEKILEEFQIQKKTFSAFKDRMINLLKDLIEKEGIIPHQIIGRTKELGSLSKKIDKKADKYKNLSDITDVVGLRIITYLESDVDFIASIIEKEFEKDEKNSIDKRVLKNDQFGYRSLHIVVSLNDRRVKLPEYANYKAIKCEIQIRSILQHAWAEIEHDLGYKGVDIPDNYKRAFNRLAALLEVADIEFVKLKQELANYERVVPKLIEESPEEVDINKASLMSFMNTNQLIQDTKNLITERTGFFMKPALDVNFDILILKYFNINTIKRLETSLEKNREGFIRFVKRFLAQRDMHESLTESVIIMYFGHYLISKQESPTLVEKYFKAHNFGFEPGDGQDYVDIYLASKGDDL